eukprot:CAMPEP_0194206238 /NCGR_PEP_ID=MMETSP0156-20130528/5325_1 /TAXON_ID=33649 /ORGANISM="Thalassionema nitzschioides, Strain L26-B" /LENGTH=129 /DNA_ID=CAMNT_0038932711 /DNA_START=325 /DNA_END=714 /DNA_ORIENTATION=+
MTASNLILALAAANVVHGRDAAGHLRAAEGDDANCSHYQEEEDVDGKLLTPFAKEEFLMNDDDDEDEEEENGMQSLTPNSTIQTVYGIGIVQECRLDAAIPLFVIRLSSGGLLYMPKSQIQNTIPNKEL